MKQATLCFLKDGEKVLLGMKKRGFGAGKWNGYGGKVKDSETLEEALIREIEEEARVKISENDLKKYGKIEYRFPHTEDDWDQDVHIFITENWDGEIEETEEMKPQWFHLDEIPFEEMWQNDRKWIPFVLEEKEFEGRVVFSEDNETADKIDLNEL